MDSDYFERSASSLPVVGLGVAVVVVGQDCVRKIPSWHPCTGGKMVYPWAS
jgi:hypothetical protein